MTRNYSPWSNGLFVSGALHVLVTSNTFSENGVMHADLYFLVKNTYYHKFFSLIAGDTYYASIAQGFIADDG